MDSKKRMYIVIIAVAAAVLIGLIIWAICLSVNRHADGTEPTGNQLETTAQIAEDTTGEAENDTTGEATTQPDDTTGEATDPTETTAEEGEKPSGSSGGSNSGSTPGSENDNKPGNKPNDEQDDEPDNEPDNGNNSGGNNNKPTPTEPDPSDAYPYNVTYQEYLDMTEEEQVAFYKCFKNHNEFKQWRTAAKKEYEDNKIKIEIGPDGKIDLSPITGKN